MNVASQEHRGSRPLTALGFTGVLLLAACASTPPAPTANLQAAQQAIAAAERSEAARYAPGELSESRAEAELASAKTSAAKANAVNDEMKRSNGTLVDEMKRGAGDKP
jgi:starvation-inducible outer membrane lipoprotein